MALKIGFTERGDAGLDLSWANKLNQVNGTVLITKNANQKFRTTVLDNDTHPFVIHIGCTGLGHSVFEPNVPEMKTQIDNALELVKAGFSIRNITLRIDPIIPVPKCIAKAADVLDYAYETKLLNANRGARLRISIYDEYRHVKARIRNLGYEPFYKDDAFSATLAQMRLVAEMLQQHVHGTTIETCAEPKFVELCQDYNIDIVAQGCLSIQDLILMNIDPNKATTYINGQQRFGCLCLRCKHELLENRKQCPHKCIYCYWQNNA